MQMTRSPEQISLVRTRRSPSWADVAADYRVGAEAAGHIVNVKEFGVFVELEPGVTGLIHETKLPSSFYRERSLEIGVRVRVRILAVEPLRKRIQLELVSVLD